MCNSDSYYLFPKGRQLWESHSQGQRDILAFLVMRKANLICLFGGNVANYMLRTALAFVSLALSITELRRLSHGGFPRSHEEKKTIS